MHHFKILMTMVLVTALYSTVHAQHAQVQFVNNSSDQIAATADFWAEDVLIDDINFRTASGFIPIPAGIDIRLAIAPGTSSSASEGYLWWTVSFEESKRYLVIANGVRNPADYVGNPDGLLTELTIQQIPDVPETSQSGTTNLLITHGVTDAPKFDIAAGLSPLAQALSYGTTSDVVPVSSENLTVTISPSGGQPLMAYKADLTPYAGKTLLLVASGFLVPAANQNGSAFGLFALPENGGPFIPLQPTAIPSHADVQFIHNTPDPDLQVIDLYVSGNKVADDVNFRSSTAFIQVPAGNSVQCSIAPANSNNVSDAVYNQTLNLPTGRHAIVLNGVMDTSKFSPNPTAEAPSITLSLTLISNIRPVALDPTGLDIMYFNGCTDCLPLSVFHGNKAVGLGLEYLSATEYASLEAGQSIVTVKNSNGDVLRTMNADISALAGQAGIVVISGFLTPSKNNNGPAMGLWVAKQSGGPLQELSTITGVDEYVGQQLCLYPNPASSTLYVAGYLPTTQTITVVAISGEILQEIQATHDYTAINGANLPAGMYAVRITDSNGFVATTFFTRSR